MKLFGYYGDLSECKVGYLCINDETYKANSSTKVTITDSKISNSNNDSFDYITLIANNGNDYKYGFLVIEDLNGSKIAVIELDNGINPSYSREFIITLKIKLTNKTITAEINNNIEFSNVKFYSGTTIDNVIRYRGISNDQLPEATSINVSNYLGHLAEEKDTINYTKIPSLIDLKIPSSLKVYSITAIDSSNSIVISYNLDGYVSYQVINLVNSYSPTNSIRVCKSDDVTRVAIFDNGLLICKDTKQKFYVRYFDDENLIETSDHEHLIRITNNSIDIEQHIQLYSTKELAIANQLNNTLEKSSGGHYGVFTDFFIGEYSINSGLKTTIQTIKGLDISGLGIIVKISRLVYLVSFYDNGRIPVSGLIIVNKVGDRFISEYIKLNENNSLSKNFTNFIEKHITIKYNLLDDLSKITENKILRFMSINRFIYYLDSNNIIRRL